MKQKENEAGQRERLASRLGFIMLSAGCAIGCGNVWKFPWMCGTYGGGGFVAIYIFFLLVLGLPAMTMEFTMGRPGLLAVLLLPFRMGLGGVCPGGKYRSRTENQALDETCFPISASGGHCLCVCLRTCGV